MAVRLLAAGHRVFGYD
ncbi:MAG: hypothetical protein ACKO23_02875, partial [Gemmataceae bacterium]